MVVLGIGMSISGVASEEIKSQGKKQNHRHPHRARSSGSDSLDSQDYCSILL
jgi:hypothetical protein